MIQNKALALVTVFLANFLMKLKLLYVAEQRMKISSIIDEKICNVPFEQKRFTIAVLTRIIIVIC